MIQILLALRLLRSFLMLNSRLNVSANAESEKNVASIKSKEDILQPN